MRIYNTSRYPDNEVRKLVEFGCRGVNMTGVRVNVKNNKYQLNGRTYHTAPSISPASGQTTVKQLVVLRIGSPNSFPCSNTVYGWERSKESITGFVRVAKGPYGGRGSPSYECADWREALVAIAAHEAYHVYLFRTGKRHYESKCERNALKRLTAYRAL